MHNEWWQLNGYELYVSAKVWRYMTWTDQWRKFNCSSEMDCRLHATKCRHLSRRRASRFDGIVSTADQSGRNFSTRAFDVFSLFWKSFYEQGKITWQIQVEHSMIFLYLTISFLSWKSDALTHHNSKQQNDRWTSVRQAPAMDQIFQSIHFIRPSSTRPECHLGFPTDAPGHDFLLSARTFLL